LSRGSFKSPLLAAKSAPPTAAAAAAVAMATAAPVTPLTPLTVATPATAENVDVQTTDFSKCGNSSASAAKASFKSPLASRAATVPSVSGTAAPVTVTAPVTNAAAPLKTAAVAAAAVAAAYFRCMHTKDVKKKHKVFDDGVLGVRGGSCTLYAMDGAVLSKSSSYSAKVLSTLVVGAELRLGARDVEVGERLANELFDSGSVFLGASAIDAAPGKGGAAAAVPPTLKFKKFVSHKEAFAGEIASRPSALAPRHDPDAEGAVVLWTPPTSADVHIVVDPFVAARLRPHQIAGVRFLFDAVARGTGCILADEMGLGKTLMSIALLWTVLKQGTPALGMPTIARRALIAVPTSLTANWVKEIKKWLGPERLRPLSIIDDDKAAIADKLRTFGAASNASPNVLVISYEQLRIHADALAAVGPISLCICDEGHRLKNPGAAITKALRALQCQSRIILSGTPIQNELNEFYAMLSFACPQLLDTLSPAAFKRLYTGPIMRAREADAKADVKQLGAQRAAKLAQLTAKCVLRRTAAILNQYLPPLTHTVLFCALSSTQRAVYERVVRDKRLLSMLSGGGGGGDALEFITLLKKLCNHPALLLKEKDTDVASTTLTPSTAAPPSSSSLADRFDVRSLLPPALSLVDAAQCMPAESGKLAVLLELLAEVRAGKSHDRVVVVSNYTQTLDLLALVCGSRHYPFVRLDGSTSLAQRQALVDRWNDVANNDLFLFLLSTKAGGVGLNLIGANRLVLFDSDWNPAADLQAMARVHRDGQKQHTYVYRLLSTGTIDEKIYQRQLSKIALSKTMLAKGATDAKTSTASFSREELRDIFSFSGNVTRCDTHAAAGCTCVRTATAEAASAPSAKAKRSAGAEAENLGLVGELQHSLDIASSVGLDPALVRAAGAIGDRVTFVFNKVQQPASSADDGASGGIDVLSAHESEPSDDAVETILAVPGEDCGGNEPSDEIEQPKKKRARVTKCVGGDDEDAGDECDDVGDLAEGIDEDESDAGSLADFVVDDDE
jgi:DNA repair and recombination protein RAD54B